LPIRAELEFNYTFSSKAKVELLESYESKAITELEKFNGIIVKASSKNTANQGVIISAVVKTPQSELKALASGLENSSLKNSNFKEVKAQNPQQFEINGLPSIRWEVVATLKGLWGANVTYMYTIIESESEFLIINTYAPTASFSLYRIEFEKIATGVAWFNPASDRLKNNESSEGHLIESPPEGITYTNN
jgi:hypothetical protein